MKQTIVVTIEVDTKYEKPEAAVYIVQHAVISGLHANIGDNPMLTAQVSDVRGTAR